MNKKRKQGDTLKRILKLTGVALALYATIATASPLENHLRSEHATEFGLTPITFDSLLKDCNTRGIGKQCFKAGLYFIDKRKEAHTGLKYMNKACTVGYSKACRVIGDYYREGRIVDYNPRMAKKFYDVGCRKGSPLSCNRYNHYFPVAKKCITPKAKPVKTFACPETYDNLYDYDAQNGFKD
jgi:hypothetical protein